MKLSKTIVMLLITLLVNCNTSRKESSAQETISYPNITIVGAMKNVMWQGKLGGSIDLDTISIRKGLYGLGPESYLSGELLINNGKSYEAKVTSDSTMTVEERYNVSAPFFVYANVNEWSEEQLPSTIKTIQDLEQFIDVKTKNYKRPFAYKLTGRVSSALIHIQNLPEGTNVASPEDAHQGQTNYKLENETVDIIGFFSTEHKGVFTHHDSFLHMHLITDDNSKMGHLDALNMEEMKLYLPLE